MSWIATILPKKRGFELIIAIMIGISLGAMVANLPFTAWVVIGAGAVLLIFPMRPAQFLLGYLLAMPLVDILIPFFTSSTAGFRFGPQVLLRGGLAVLLVGYWLVTQRNPLIFKAAVPMLALLILLGLNTISRNILLQITLADLMKIAFWMFLLLTVADLVMQGKMHLDTIYRCTLVSTLIFIGALQISALLGAGGSDYDVGEVTGAFTPHSVAVSLAMGFIVTLGLASDQHRRLLQLLLLVFSVLIAISIARTYVRTAYVALINVLLTLNFAVWRYGKGEEARRQRLLLGVSLIVITGVLIVYGLTHVESLQKRFSDIADLQDHGAGSGRIGIYTAAIKAYSEFPMFQKVFGGGLGSAMTFLGEGLLKGTHNEYLAVLLAGGLVGIGLYLWLFISLWTDMRSNVRDRSLPFIMATCAGTVYAVAAMTNGVWTYVTVMTYFSFLVGGAIGYYRLESGAQQVHETDRNV